MFKQVYIKYLIIEGFKGYKEKTELRLSDITKIAAPNGHGKTSIGEAISWAFLGTNLWGNEKVDSDLLNNSSKKMQVTVKFTDGEKDYLLQRNRVGSSTKILLNNKIVKQVELTAMLGSKEIFLSIFNPEYFNSMGDKNGRDFLISILPDINIENILEKIDDYSIEYIRDDLQLIHNSPNLYMQERRSEIKELETDLVFNEGVLSKLDIFQDSRDMKVFDTKHLEKLENELDNLSITKSEPVTTEYEKLIEEKNMLEKEVVAMTSKEFSKLETITEIKELAMLEKEISLLEIEKYETPEDVLRELLTLEAQYMSLREDYKKQQNISLNEGDRCPVCMTSINHTHLEMLKEEIGYILEKLAEKGKNKALEITNFKKSIELKEKEFNSIKELKIKEYKDKYNSLSEKVKRLEESNKSNEILFQKKKEKAIATLQNKIKSIENKMDKIKTDYLAKEEARLKEINNRKEELRKKIIDLRKEKAQIDAYNMEIKILQENMEKNIVERNKLLKENTRINEKITNYKSQIEICKEYTNIKVQLLSDKIHSYLNDVTIELQKVVISTGEVKDCFEIKYKGTRYKTISRSEAIKVGLEISNLIRNITKYNYPIFVDNAESITKYATPEMAQVIETKVTERQDLGITLAEREIKLNIAI